MSIYYALSMPSDKSSISVRIFFLGFIPLFSFFCISIVIFSQLSQSSLDEGKEILEEDSSLAILRLIEEKADTNTRYFEKIQNLTYAYSEFTELIWQNPTNYVSPKSYLSGQCFILKTSIRGQYIRRL